MNLQDLVGEHLLDAVDFGSVKKESWGGGYEDCQTMRFRLDGIVYVALEDPSDGYRSCMESLQIATDEPANRFPPVRVVARYRDRSGYNAADVLEIIVASNGKTVIEVGTENSDDYYPSFVAHFNPTAIPEPPEVVK